MPITKLTELLYNNWKNYLYGAAEDVKFDPKFKVFEQKFLLNMRQKVISIRRIFLKKKWVLTLSNLCSIFSIV